ncbi:MAG: glycosyltransferase family 4 protein [Anaerolineae bacterium]
MRVLHVSHQYPPAIGGSERYIADLSEELAARGHQVDVFTSRAVDFHTWQNKLPSFDRQQGVNVYRFRSLQRRAYVWQILHFGLNRYWHKRERCYEPFIFLGGGPISPGMLAALLRRGRQYDLIHLNCLVYSHVAYGYWAAQRLKVPTIVTPHAHAEQPVTYDVGYQHRILAGCDHILADTPIERDFLIGLGLPTPKVSLGGVGLRPELYPIGDQATARQKLGLPQTGSVALFLGRKDKYKGLEISLQAFEQMQGRYPDLHFLAVGPETDESQAMWPRYQGLKQLHNRGAVSDEEKLLALQACDVLMLPSVGEAFGIVFLEAWLAGKPVIGARTLAVSTVIDEYRDGLLAEPEDVGSLARQIAFLLDRPERRVAMGERGRAKVLANYTVARVTDRVEAIYQQVLAQRRGTIRTIPMSSSQPLESTEAQTRIAPAAIARIENLIDLSADQAALADVIEVRDPEIDQQAIRQQIGAQVARRRAAGGYGPEPARFGPPSQPTAPKTTATSVPSNLAEIDRELAILTASQTVHEPAFQSSAPVIGPLIVAVRRAWNWMSTKWYVRPIVAQQNRINQQSVSVISAVARQQEIYEQRLSELQARVAELEQQLARQDRTP